MAKYLTAAEIAAICDVDLKTIHNWADKPGMALAHFRTPGRHLRFKPREVVPWLLARGYDVQADLQEQARADAEAHEKEQLSVASAS